MDDGFHTRMDAGPTWAGDDETDIRERFARRAADPADGEKRIRRGSEAGRLFRIEQEGHEKALRRGSELRRDRQVD